MDIRPELRGTGKFQKDGTSGKNEEWENLGAQSKSSKNETSETFAGTGDVEK